MEDKQVPGIICTYLYVCVPACLPVRMYLCMYVCMYVSMYLHIFLLQHLANRNDMDDEFEPAWGKTLNQVYWIYVHIYIYTYNQDTYYRVYDSYH